MAQSGELSTSISYIKYRIIVTESSTSVSNNTSNVRVQIRAWGNKTGTNYDYDGQSRIKIDGVEYPFSSWSKGQKSIGYSSDHGETGYTIIYDNTHTIYHNYDGTKKIRVSAYFELYGNGLLTLGSNFNNSYEFTLTDLNRLGSTLNAIGELDLANSSSVKLYANVYNTTNTHTLTLKRGNTSIVSVSGISLNDGYNDVSLDVQVIGTIMTYMTSNNLVSFVAKWELSTQSGSSSVGSSSSVTGLVYITQSSGTTLVSLRSSGMGIKNTNPQYELDVNGTVNCTTLQQSTPTMEIQDGHIIKILRW